MFSQLRARSLLPFFFVSRLVPSQVCPIVLQRRSGRPQNHPFTPTLHRHLPQDLMSVYHKTCLKSRRTCVFLMPKKGTEKHHTNRKCTLVSSLPSFCFQKRQPLDLTLPPTHLHMHRHTQATHIPAMFSTVSRRFVRRLVRTCPTPSPAASSKGMYYAALKRAGRGD